MKSLNLNITISHKLLNRIYLYKKNASGREGEGCGCKKDYNDLSLVRAMYHQYTFIYH